MPSENSAPQPGRPPSGGGIRLGVLVLAAVAVALALGVGLGQWSGPGALGGVPGAPTGATAPEAGALREALAQEREAREELEERLQELELRLAQLELGGLPGAAAGSAATRGAEPAAESASAAEAGQAEDDDAPSDAAPAAASRSWFDEQKLVASGLDPLEAGRLKDAWEQMELGKLYLADRAAREGWGRSFNHRAQQQGLERALRREVGDDGWDWILFATGQPNRVRVQGVLDSSPAADSGLVPGDVILSYGDERIFRPRELKQATREGVPGESIRVDLLRQGQPVSVYVPRGPLGAQLRADRMPPREG